MLKNKHIALKLLIYLSLVISPFFVLSCGTPSTLTPIADVAEKSYSGTAKLLIAVDGTDDREVRHIEIGTAEEEGYEIYFHDKKVGEGFIVLDIPVPSTDVHIQEYSLTGVYGCSRGKAGYGFGYKSIARVLRGKTYFLGTINTSMNTTYKEMPESLVDEAKEKHNYRVKDSDREQEDVFKSRISLGEL